jgi:hypothetical protein
VEPSRCGILYLQRHAGNAAVATLMASPSRRERTLQRQPIHMASGGFVGTVGGSENNRPGDVTLVVRRLFLLGYLQDGHDYEQLQHLAPAFAQQTGPPLDVFHSVMRRVALPRLSGVALGVLLRRQVAGGVGDGELNAPDDVRRLRATIVELRVGDAPALADEPPDQVTPALLRGLQALKMLYLGGQLDSVGTVAVTAKLTELKDSGQKFTYPDAREASTTFESWAMQSQETPPRLDQAFKMNCWEAVLLAAYLAGAVRWTQLHALYKRNDPRWEDEEIGAWENQVGSFLSPEGATWQDFPAAGGAQPPRPARGDIVFFNGMDHVAMATGTFDAEGRSEILSFWPPPGDWDRKAKVEEVKLVTVEAIKTWWTSHGRGAARVSFGPPSWR